MSNMVWTLERQRAERQHLRGRGDAQGSGPSPEASTTILEQRLPPSFGGAAGVSVHLYSIWLRGRGYEVQGVRTLAYFGELAHQDINQNIPDCLQLDHPVRAFPAIQRGQLIARRGGKGFGRSTGLLPRSPRGLRRK
jgi:hypothetical protein